MKRRTSEQIVQLLHDSDEELGKGKGTEDVCRNKDTQRPHSSLAYQTPATFAQKLASQPALSLIPAGYKN